MSTTVLHTRSGPRRRGRRHAQPGRAVRTSKQRQPETHRWREPGRASVVKNRVQRLHDDGEVGQDVFAVDGVRHPDGDGCAPRGLAPWADVNLLLAGHRAHDRVAQWRLGRPDGRGDALNHDNAIVTILVRARVPQYQVRLAVLAANRPRARHRGHERVPAGLDDDVGHRLQRGALCERPPGQRGRKQRVRRREPAGAAPARRRSSAPPRARAPALPSPA